MSRATFTTILHKLAFECNGVEHIQLDSYPQLHDDKDYVVRLAYIQRKRPVLVHVPFIEPFNVEFDGPALAAPSIELDIRIFTTLSPALYKKTLDVKAPYTSTSSDSTDTASLTFTPGEYSKRSSRVTSINSNETSQQLLPTVQINGIPIDLDGLSTGLQFWKARNSRRRRPQVPELNTNLLSPTWKPRNPVSASQPPKSPAPPSETFPEPSQLETINWFLLPPSTPSLKTPLIASLLTSLTPNLLKWRLLTFYSSFLPYTIQRVQTTRRRR